MKKAVPQYQQNSLSYGNSSTQCLMLLHELIASGPGGLNTFEIRARGIPHAAGRIADLRDAGHEINTSLETVTGQGGREHQGVAVYALLRLAEGWSE